MHVTALTSSRASLHHIHIVINHIINTTSAHHIPIIASYTHHYIIFTSYIYHHYIIFTSSTARIITSYSHHVLLNTSSILIHIIYMMCMMYVYDVMHIIYTSSTHIIHIIFTSSTHIIHIIHIIRHTSYTHHQHTSQVPSSRGSHTTIRKFFQILFIRTQRTRNVPLHTRAETHTQ